MGLLRLTIRATLILTMTVVLCVLRLMVWPVCFVSERADRRVRRFILQCWNWWFAWVGNIKITAEGPKPVPPFFMVANHLSYLDMVTLTHQTGCIYVSRGDVEHWPVIGFLSKSMYVIFVDRQSRRDTLRVNRLIEHAIQQGDAVTIFAESHITVGQDVEQFKSALIEPAVALAMPVYYATITYETLPGEPPASEVVSWWRPEGFMYHLGRLLRQKGVIARVRFGEEPLTGTDRKELAVRLWEAVRANYVPIK